MTGLMGFDLLFDMAKLALSVVGIHLGLQAGVRRWRPGWSPRLTQRRVAVLGLLTLAMAAIKLIEDVVAEESGPADTAILWFLREHMPVAMYGVFALFTLTGSAAFLLPASGLAVLALQQRAAGHHRGAVVDGRCDDVTPGARRALAYRCAGGAVPGHVHSAGIQRSCVATVRATNHPPG